MCNLHDITVMLLSVTVQDIEAKDDPANLTAFPYWRFCSRNTRLKTHEFILVVTMFSLCTSQIF